MKKNVHRIIKERERVWSTLVKLGVHVYSSSANFLLMKAGVPDAAEKFKEIGVLVSDLSNQLPPGFIRVSIGTREENDAFISGYLQIREAFA